jgi:hypothetical protein
MHIHAASVIELRWLRATAYRGRVHLEFPMVRPDVTNDESEDVKRGVQGTFVPHLGTCRL